MEWAKQRNGDKMHSPLLYFTLSEETVYNQ